MKSILKWIGGAVGALIILLILVIAFQVISYNRSADRVRDVAPVDLAIVSDSAAVAQGYHIAAALGGCLGCHGPDLGGATEDLGPLGVMTGPNLTTGNGGVGSSYTDAELARAIRYGIRNDGTSLRFMPTPEHNWWSDDDLASLVAYLRSVPPVDRDVGQASVGILGKLLNQFGMMPLLSADMVDPNAPPEDVPDPEPTARYGIFLARSCAGCHGPQFGGGPIPGAPSTLPAPSNLTFHETGLGNWSREDFETALTTGVRPDGSAIDPFMPVQATSAMNDLERSALWEYFRSLEPREYGSR